MSGSDDAPASTPGQSDRQLLNPSQSQGRPRQDRLSVSQTQSQSHTPTSRQGDQRTPDAGKAGSAMSTSGPFSKPAIASKPGSKPPSNAGADLLAVTQPLLKAPAGQKQRASSPASLRSAKQGVRTKGKEIGDKAPASGNAKPSPQANRARISPVGSGAATKTRTTGADAKTTQRRQPSPSPTLSRRATVNAATRDKQAVAGGSPKDRAQLQQKQQQEKRQTSKTTKPAVAGASPAPATRPVVKRQTSNTKIKVTPPTDGRPPPSKDAAAAAPRASHVPGHSDGTAEHPEGDPTDATTRRRSTAQAGQIHILGESQPVQIYGTAPVPGQHRRGSKLDASFNASTGLGNLHHPALEPFGRDSDVERPSVTTPPQQPKQPKSKHPQHLQQQQEESGRLVVPGGPAVASAASGSSRASVASTNMSSIHARDRQPAHTATGSGSKPARRATSPTRVRPTIDIHIDHSIEVDEAGNPVMIRTVYTDDDQDAGEDEAARLPENPVGGRGRAASISRRTSVSGDPSRSRRGSAVSGLSTGSARVARHRKMPETAQEAIEQRLRARRASAAGGSGGSGWGGNGGHSVEDVQEDAADGGEDGNGAEGKDREAGAGGGGGDHVQQRSRAPSSNASSTAAGKAARTKRGAKQQAGKRGAGARIGSAGGNGAATGSADALAEGDEAGGDGYDRRNGSAGAPRQPGNGDDGEGDGDDGRPTSSKDRKPKDPNATVPLKSPDLWIRGKDGVLHILSGTKAQVAPSAIGESQTSIWSTKSMGSQQILKRRSTISRKLPKHVLPVDDNDVGGGWNSSTRVRKPAKVPVEVITPILRSPDIIFEDGGDSVRSGSGATDRRKSTIRKSVKRAGSGRDSETGGGVLFIGELDDDDDMLMDGHGYGKRMSVSNRRRRSTIKNRLAFEEALADLTGVRITSGGTEILMHKERKPKPVAASSGSAANAAGSGGAAQAAEGGAAGAGRLPNADGKSPAAGASGAAGGPGYSGGAGGTGNVSAVVAAANAAAALAGRGRQRSNLKTLYNFMRRTGEGGRFEHGGKRTYMGMHLQSHLMSPPFPMPPKHEILFGPYEDGLAETEAAMAKDGKPAYYYSPERYLFPIRAFDPTAPEHVRTYPPSQQQQQQQQQQLGLSQQHMHGAGFQGQQGYASESALMSMSIGALGMRPSYSMDGIQIGSPPIYEGDVPSPPIRPQSSDPKAHLQLLQSRLNDHMQYQDSGDGQMGSVSDMQGGGGVYDQQQQQQQGETGSQSSFFGMPAQRSADPPSRPMLYRDPHLYAAQQGLHHYDGRLALPTGMMPMHPIDPYQLYSQRMAAPQPYSLSYHQPLQPPFQQNPDQHYVFYRGTPNTASWPAPPSSSFPLCAPASTQTHLPLKPGAAHPNAPWMRWVPLPPLNSTLAPQAVAAPAATSPSTPPAHPGGSSLPRYRHQ